MLVRDWTREEAETSFYFFFGAGVVMMKRAD